MPEIIKTAGDSIRKNIFLLTGILLLLLFIVPGSASAQQQRFPMPEFQTGYELPDTDRPEPRAPGMEIFDLAVLVLVLAFTTWLVLKRRSRKLVFWTSVFALLYFGFYRNGCICPIGGVQNVSLALFGDGYILSLTVLAFFVIPLFVTLFAGRIFCASACPLGVIQDLVIIKPVKLPQWLQRTLGLIPFIFLGFAVLYAATGTTFIICRYDPFVGIFRMGASFSMAILGVSFLAAGIFVARPYCRFLCPYGAILRVFSIFSSRHMSITPEECINCKLCEDSCPFDAIDYPNDEKKNRATKADYRRFVFYSAAIPVLIIAGALAVSGSYKLLSKVHPDVYLANLLVEDPGMMYESDMTEIETFMASDRTLEMLVADATEVQSRFRRGGYYLGGFLGLLIGLSLTQQVTFRKRTIYEVNRGSCYSCGRCMEYCPVGKPDHPYHKEDNNNHS